MRLFLDASVLLAGCGSETGASREIFRRHRANGWELIVTPYVVNEVMRHIHRLPGAEIEWATIRPSVRVARDVFTVNRPVVFGPAKDRPILFGALAWADILLTLDRADFGGMMGGKFYRLAILTPAMFLNSERLSGRLGE